MIEQERQLLTIPIPALRNDRILRAARRLPVDRTPVWMMRQAGRSDPGYRRIREEINLPLEHLFRTCPVPMSETAVEWAVKISMLPKRIGVDAIIVYKDILTPLCPMGAHFRFMPGPVLSEPIRSREQVEALQPLNDAPTQLAFTGKVIRTLRKTLNGELPLIGFAGAPMTLAAFLIAGTSPMKRGSEVPRPVKAVFQKRPRGTGPRATVEVSVPPPAKAVFQMLTEAPELAHQLLARLTEATINYLNYQIAEGVQIVQLFESIADVMPREMYQEFMLPYHQQIFAELNRSVPAILFAKECAELDLMHQSGADVLSVGKCVNLAQAKVETAENPVAFQGNVDNDILRDGTFADITTAVHDCLRQGGKTGHILNLSHGLHRDTPFENVKHFVQAAKTFRREQAEASK